MPGTIVFISALNEEDNLPAVLAELREELDDVTVLVVDDGSTDATADVARAEGAEVLSFGENRGLREGIAAGYRYACEHAYDFAGRVDANGQHPVNELRRLLELVRSDECDVAIGSRFAAGEGYEPYSLRAVVQPTVRDCSSPPRDAARARQPVPRRNERDVRSERDGDADPGRALRSGAP